MKVIAAEKKNKEELKEKKQKTVKNNEFFILFLWIIIFDKLVKNQVFFCFLLKNF